MKRLITLLVFVTLFALGDVAKADQRRYEATVAARRARVVARAQQRRWQPRYYWQPYGYYTTSDWLTGYYNGVIQTPYSAYMNGYIQTPYTAYMNGYLQTPYTALLNGWY